MTMQAVQNLSIRDRAREARIIRARLMNLPKLGAETIPEPLAPAPPPAALTQAQIDRARWAREAGFIEMWNRSPIKNIRAIINAGKTHFTRTETELMSHRRHRLVVRPRQVVMFLAAEHTALSFCEIGRRLGDFDHTTVMHAARTVKDLVAGGDMEMIYDVAHMENMLGVR